MTTKEELLARLNDIEWTDFEVKEASGGLPKSMWETVKREWALDALPIFWIDYMEIPGILMLQLRKIHLPALTRY